MSVMDTASSTARTIKEYGSGKWNQILAMLAVFDAFLQHREDLGEAMAERKFNTNTRLGQVGQVATVVTVVAIGVVSVIGILIYAQVSESLSRPADTELNNSMSNVTDGFGSAMDLVPTVLIVIVASLVIGVVQRLR